MGFGVFYIIKCWNSKEYFYKVGITSYSVKRRYNSKRDMPYNYEIIQEITDIPNNVWNLELLLKQYIKNNNFHYIPNIQFGGYLNECFKYFNERSL